ncbi:aminotransferase class I/II-fold pyridoxal phosphate-dependent enzyme [Amycolatopsis pigmentata]|uniref:Aminotransferase class I/II-fold pyridoxal phosphate-dependent enzyme n=1 Tax=Amycolatopsis pigmentata TaxID=450801 RepID=A0ABW5FZM8_9PSEU
MRPKVADGDFFDMSLNECPYPPLPEVQEAAKRSIERAHLTLDAISTKLGAAIADHHGVPATDVLVGPGSGSLLQQLFTTIAGPSGATVHAWPSWEAYPIMAANAGSRTIGVPLAGDVHDLDAMAAAVTPDTRMVLVCNPNNPTGTAVGPAAMRAFLDALPSDVVVVIDEAYRDFSADEVADGIELYRNDDRVCVVRTFSKSYSLLSLRVGYLVAHGKVTERLRGTTFFNRVSSVAQDAAMAALAAHETIARRWAETRNERDRVREALVEQGWQVSPSEGNFLWIATPEHAEALTGFCAENGVVVCGKPGEGVRVTIAEKAANDAFVDAAGRFSP